MPLFSSAPQSICIMRLSALGDVCNTIAAVQAIQKQWPSTKISWITGKLEAQLLQDLPGIEVVIFDKKLGWKAYTKLWAELKDHHFDALLHMQYALRASVATLGIKAKYKLGFDKQRSQDFQTCFTNVKVPSPSQPHVLDGLLAFAKNLGIEDITPHWAIPYTDEDAAWAKQHIPREQRSLIVVPAASKAYKNWTISGYAEVIRHAYQQGMQIILAGSPAKIEIQLATDIENILTDVPVINLVGHSSIKQMIALIDLADLVIAPDTGPTHIANAMNTPVIGLYAHHNPKRTGPYRFQQYVVSAYEEAIKAEHNDTEHLNWRTRVKDERAMERIKASQVIECFERVIRDYQFK